MSGFIFKNTEGIKRKREKWGDRLRETARQRDTETDSWRERMRVWEGGGGEKESER